MSGKNKEKWGAIFGDPSRLWSILAVTSGALLLTEAMRRTIEIWQASGGIGPFNYGWVIFFTTFAFLLLGTRRVFRELLVAASLLGASWWGFSQILQQVWEPGSIAPAKATIIIVVILSWTILVALGLGRLHGRDED